MGEMFISVRIGHLINLLTDFFCYITKTFNSFFIMHNLDQRIDCFLGFSSMQIILIYLSLFLVHPSYFFYLSSLILDYLVVTSDGFLVYCASIEEKLTMFHLSLLNLTDSISQQLCILVAYLVKLWQTCNLL